MRPHTTTSTNSSSTEPDGMQANDALANEVETLKLRQEVDELRDRTLARPQPWWQRSTTVTAVTAIIAATVPLTTLVREAVQQYGQYALQRARQDEELKTAYLERLKTPGEHMRTLRFIIGTSSDAQLVSWAKQEKAKLEKRLAELRAQLSLRLQEIEAARQAYRQALEQSPEGKRAFVQSEYERLLQDRNALQSQIAEMAEDSDLPEESAQGARR